MSKPPPKSDPVKAPAPAAAKPPDAALLDRDGEDVAEAVSEAPARTGLRRFLPTSVPGWAAAASLLLVILGGSTAAALLFAGTPQPAASPNITGSARAVDGRTLVVAGQTIYLQGIDAPPASLICRDGVWEYKCGEDSRKALDQVIASGPVDCEPVPSASGVIVGECRLEQGNDLGAAMIEAGWAVADLRFSSRYLPQQAKARDESRGLWRNNFAFPEQWRLAARGAAR